jgi:hypothetical protein
MKVSDALKIVNLKEQLKDAKEEIKLLMKRNDYLYNLLDKIDWISIQKDN